MAYAEGSGSACPGCLAAPMALDRSGRAISSEARVIRYSLPSVHCGACISTIETGLLDVEGIDDIRVNLTRKRATVHARSHLSDEEIAARIAALGYEAELLDGAVLLAQETDSISSDLLMRLGIAGFAMMNVMLLSVAVWAGAEDATRDMFHWISAIITLPVVVYSGKPFFTNAADGLSRGRLNMDFPISLAIILASAMSLFETVQGGEHAYFDAALSLTFFLLAGRYLDHRTRAIARSAAAELSAVNVATALRLPEGPQAGEPQTIKASEVALGDRLLVRPGARIPVDGLVVSGVSELDRSILTGETDPVTVADGGMVRAGEMNLTGPLQIRATAVGADTSLAGLADLIAVAEDSKSRYNSLADRAARLYAPVVHILALAAFFGWLIATNGDLRLALNIAVATLIITCPCALGLAVPAVSTVASGRLFRDGVLVKHGTALERLAEATEVVFDKTGTLTTGVPRLVTPLQGEALALAAGLAQGSSHPRSEAIMRAARGLDLPQVSNRREVPGMGIEGEAQGIILRLGRAAWVGRGEGTVFCMGEEFYALEFADELRDGAAETIDALQSLGLPVTLLSGDAAPAVAELAAKANLRSWQAEMTPEEKVAFIQQRQDAGAKLLMVGDGLNDTAALAVAYVSMAPAQAIEATRVAADFVITTPSLTPVARAQRLAVVARRRILENFALAALYNSVAIPVALAGFATPLAAAIAMSSSSIIVSLNALRTR